MTRRSIWRYGAATKEGAEGPWDENGSRQEHVDRESFLLGGASAARGPRLIRARCNKAAQRSAFDESPLTGIGVEPLALTTAASLEALAW